MLVLKKPFDPVAAHDVRIAWLNLVIAEAVTVEFADAVPSCKPHEAVFVLDHIHDGILWKPIFCGIVCELTCRLRCRRLYGHPEQKDR